MLNIQRDMEGLVSALAAGESVRGSSHQRMISPSRQKRAAGGLYHHALTRLQQVTRPVVLRSMTAVENPGTALFLD